jgi:TolB protein
MTGYKAALPLAALALLAAACRTEVIAPELPESPGEVITPSPHPILFSSLRDSTYGVNQRPNLEVMKMSASGSEIVNISKHPASDTDASWSPDGKYVAFASNRNGGFDIFVMREDGSEVRQLTWDTLDERFPRWSPDGKNIVFESPRDGLIPKPGYPRYSDLFVVTSDGSHMYNLTRTPARSERWATWSPDGKTIAYTRSDSTATQIYLINPDGTGARPLRTPAPGYLDDAAAWSPDGSRIAFSAFNLNHPMYIETFVIFSVRTDGSDLQALTGTGYDSARFPAWSPDGKHILFNRDNLDEWWGRFSTQNLWIMNSDGSGKTRITQDASRRNELGSPDAWRE